MTDPEEPRAEFDPQGPREEAVGPPAGARDPEGDEGPDPDGGPPAPADGTPELAEFEALLEYLKRSRGFDFTGYKRSSLLRRVRKRMEMVGPATFARYQDHLEVHPEEFGRLFDTILINVTAFFRDPPVWDLLASEVVPRMVAGRKPDEPIRVWVAGCASGEEAYTLAIVFAEVLGVDQARDRVKIYATDVDDALARARQAVYKPRELETVPEPLRRRYFEPLNHRAAFHRELRRSVIFGRHDLIQDAPISRVDLLTCRNTLMYFNGETQARILDRFHFALHERGFLVLGKAETLLAHNSGFAAVDLKRRVFAKLNRGDLRERARFPATRNGDEGINHLISHVRIREAAFDAAPIAQVVIDAHNILALANERARALFGLFPADLGRPLQDLQISYRPVELRAHLDRLAVERRPVQLKEVEWANAQNEVVFFDVQIAPLLDPGGAVIGASVTFQDVTGFRRLQVDLQRSHRELETAYEELQSTNEELETTNEELQSTVEELETTNEELQSTNEELETMNEELQSTNEELETLNAELGQRGDELNEVNTFLESILGSLREGVVVVDRDFLVRIWNHRAEDLWGLRADEVRGKNLLNLDIGLPVERLKGSIRATLADGGTFQEVTLDAVNRRGRAIRCRVACNPLVGAGDLRRGAILLMGEAESSRAPAADPGGSA